MIGNKFKAQYRTNQQAEEEHPPKVGRLPEKNDPDQYCPGSADTGPDGIGRAHGDILDSLVQKIETERDADEKEGSPSLVRKVRREFQACGEAHFK